VASLSFNLFSWRVGAMFSVKRVGVVDVDALTNRCVDGRYVVFLDYDDRVLDWVVDELRYLQLEQNLGTFYLFRSSKDSFHAVCFDKLTFIDYLTVLNRSSCDPNYRKVPFLFGKRLWTLRFSPKKNVVPQLVKVLFNPSTRTQSTPHKKFFSRLHGFEPEVTEEDNIGGDESLIYASYKI
jgi:hypothetical protein